MNDQATGHAGPSPHRHPTVPSACDANPKFSEVIEFIDHHYGEHLSLESVAEFACMSKYHFSRLFHRVIGVTFQEYLALLRVMKAEELMRQGPSRSVTRIALEVGFGSLRNMEKHFRSRVGLTPSEYRARQRPKRATSFASLTREQHRSR
jgi:transcriptional regulator GlxA family with amidase domain